MLIRTTAAATLVALAACSEPELATRQAAVTIEKCAPDQIFCDEVDHKPRSNPDLDSFTLAPGDLNTEGQVIFTSSSETPQWSVRMVIALDDRPRDATYVDVSVRDRRFRVVTASTPPQDRRIAGVTILDAGNRSLDDVTLIETLNIAVSGGTARLGGGDLALLETSTQTALGRAHFDPGLTAVPGTCKEKALVRFGPIPWNMPPLKFPEIESCSAERCVSITEGWIRGHHHVWRLSQMFSVMSNASSAYRSFLWGQPAIDWSGNAVGTSGSSTSPKFYFGEYSSERFYAAREAVWVLLDVFLKAKTLASKIHLKCGSCSGYGKHSTIGWINVCPNAFADSANLYPADQDAVTHTVIHEATHWLSVEFDAGPRALRDTFTHGHGSTCLSNITTTYVDELADVIHLATYVAPDGEGCWHQNYAVQAIESYANFAMRIGEGVRDGELYRWPKLADPTPQPPDCVGGEGCLCNQVPAVGPPIPPDGDFSINHYCEDNDGEMTCVETKVNAGAIVGICTKCDPVRGPGCECDFSNPCDVGSCWGDDTWNGGVGHCYEDPPSWACLADCERLFNDGLAYCYNNHLGGARCMDSDCPKWKADECYQQGKICRYGQCVVECTSTADCDALGYPSYFECSTAGRCEYPF